MIVTELLYKAGLPGELVSRVFQFADIHVVHGGEYEIVNDRIVRKEDDLFGVPRFPTKEYEFEMIQQFFSSGWRGFYHVWIPRGGFFAHIKNKLYFGAHVYPAPEISTFLAPVTSTQNMPECEGQRGRCIDRLNGLILTGSRQLFMKQPRAGDFKGHPPRPEEVRRLFDIDVILFNRQDEVLLVNPASSVVALRCFKDESRGDAAVMPIDRVFRT